MPRCNEDLKIQLALGVPWLETSSISWTRLKEGVSERCFFVFCWGKKNRFDWVLFCFDWGFFLLGLSVGSIGFLFVLFFTVNPILFSSFVQSKKTLLSSWGVVTCLFFFFFEWKKFSHQFLQTPPFWSESFFQFHLSF